MFHSNRNIDAITRVHFYSILSPFLVISSSCNTNEYLATTLICMMDMPIVSATGLKCYIKNSNLLHRNRCKIALTNKVFCKCIIRLSYWKYHRRLMLCLCIIFIRSFFPYIFSKTKRCPSFWPANIKCYMCNNCHYLFFCNTIFFAFCK